MDKRATEAFTSMRVRAQIKELARTALKSFKGIPVTPEIRNAIKNSITHSLSEFLIDDAKIKVVAMDGDVKISISTDIYTEREDPIIPEDDDDDDFEESIRQRRPHFNTKAIKGGKITRLSRERQRRGLCQDVVAKKVGISPSHLSRIETGYTKPKLHVKKALADFYGILYKDLKKWEPLALFDNPENPDDSEDTRLAEASAT